MGSGPCAERDDAAAIPNAAPPCRSAGLHRALRLRYAEGRALWDVKGSVAGGTRAMDMVDGSVLTEALGLGDGLGTARAAAGEPLPSPDHGTVRRLQRGDVLIERGEVASSLFIVMRGRFDVRVDGRTVAEVTEGQPVGEIAFFTGGERTADVVAGRDATVLELTRAQFDALVAERPHVGIAVTTWLALRLARVAARSPALERPAPRCTALVPAGADPVPSAFVDALRRAMPEVRFVGPTDLPPGVDADDEGAVADHLFASEGKSERTIYLAERDDGFGRAAVRQSDAVMAVGMLGGSDRRPSPLERYAAEMHETAHMSLVLCRERFAQPIGGTPEWLAPRSVSLHHHVALDRAADVERVARFVLGEARGMVMGGGGALGCAHLGVARALQDGGIAIDMWGGTSIGGAMAMALGMGLDPTEIMDRAETIFVRNLALGRYTVPLYSLIDQDNFDRNMREHFGVTDLTDLPFNAFAASTSLSTNDLHVHRTGPTWEAVRASGSLPLVLPPFVTAEGEVLVDGGLLDNLPIGIMRGLKRGPNVMVNLAPDRQYRLKSAYRDFPTRRLTILSDMARKRRRGDLPKMGSVLSRAMVVASRRVMAATEIGDDILVEPPSIGRMGLMDWKKGRQQEQRAYEHTMARIKRGELAALH